MDYLDFVIRLEFSDGGWKTRVIESPAGEGWESLDLGIHPKAWAQLWFSQADRVRQPRCLETAEEVADALDIGQLPQTLFRALFSGETLRLWDRSLGQAAPGGVRLHLRFDAREAATAPLLPLPWELSQDPLGESFYGPSALTPILRVLEVPQVRPAGSIPRPLRVLLVAPQPKGALGLEVGEEARAIQEAFQGSDVVEIERLPRARLDDLRDHLRNALRRSPDDGYHILHFMGHGQLDPATGEGCLVFEDQESQRRRVSGRVLATQLRDFRDTLRLVVVNACHSGAQRGGEGRDPFAGVAAALVRDGLPAVVAMQLPISDTAAVAFARAFYRQVANSEPVEVAVALGRQAILEVEPHTFEWAVPALFSRLRDGRLFESEKPMLSLDERLRQILNQESQELSDQTLEDAAHKALMGEAVSRAEPALSRALMAEPVTGMLRAARLVKRLELFTPLVAEALTVARHRDQPPWPVESALMAIARHDIHALPHSRRSLRRILGRNPQLTKRFQQHAGWRRVAAAIYGGFRHDGRIDPNRFHHEAEALTPWVVETLKADEAPEQRLWQLRALSRAQDREDASDLLLARVALGDPLAIDETKQASNSLRRSLAVLESVEPSVEAWLPVLQGLPKQDLAPLLEWLPDNRAIPTALLSIARSQPPEARLPWLTQLLRRLLRRDGRSSIYNLAVTLDTQGAFLSSAPEVLAQAVVLARPLASSSPPPPRDQQLCAALDAIATLPESFGFFAGWLLVCLSRPLQAAGLLPEALAITLQLSDRMAAREDTLRRLVASATPGALGALGKEGSRRRRPARALQELAATLEDAWLRFRMVRRIAQGWPLLRHPLCHDRLGSDTASASPAAATVWAIAQRDEREWAATELRRLRGAATDLLPKSIEPMPAGTRHPLLDLEIDTRWPAFATVVARALTADALARVPDTPGKHQPGPLQPVSRLGIPMVTEIARQWLGHREDDPKNALRWRWRFEAVEHDDADALEAWAAAVASGVEPEASEAEAILGNIQALRGNLAGVVRELLADSVPRVRKALLRSLTYLLARRRLSDAVWNELAQVLPGLADDNLMEDEHFVLHGPGAVVAAIGAVRQRLDAASATISPVEAARQAYDRWRQPWTEALRRPPEALRQTLTAIGEEWLVSRRSRQEIEDAARRVALESPVFDILLDWASEEMRRDVRQRNPDDYLLGDLLSVLAGAAEPLRSRYRARLSTLPIWERQLCEAAREADWFPTRAAALKLLLLQEGRSSNVLAALRDAGNDIDEVRRVIREFDDAT